MPADPQESAAADQAGPAAAASGGGKAAVRGRYRDALRHRDLRLLIASFLVDQVGSWSYAVVISVYIFDRTHSTQWLAAFAVCRWGPGLLLASYGGVIADRYQRTTVMIVSSLASAVLMIGMAVVVGLDAPVSLVLAISALSSAVSAKGALRFAVYEGTANAQVFINFCQRLLHDAPGPVYLIVNGHPAHRATATRQFAASTEGRLRLIFLPGYSPELNPDEWVWRNVKHDRIGKTGVTSKDDLKSKAIGALRRLQKRPRLVRAFFADPHLRYITA